MKCRFFSLQYLQPNGNNWRWFDDRSGRWCSYSAGNNGTIDAAWRSGESSVRFTAGRRRYTVQFNTMVQVNEETGNRRPVMLTVQRLPRLGKNGKNGSSQELEKPLEESKETEQEKSEEKAGPGTRRAHEHTRTHAHTPAGDADCAAPAPAGKERQEREQPGAGETAGGEQGDRAREE
ncbi:UNVERIFIED_CONTAM: hypothetical protein FKN15_055484 [Acipenser sinensis]